MDFWVFNFFASLLLLLPALRGADLGAGQEGPEQARVHDAWCRRVCPGQPPSPSSAPRGDPGPGPSSPSPCAPLLCPQPVCPVPICPPHPAPPVCPPPPPCPPQPPAPPCAHQTPSSRAWKGAALPWHALQLYNSTYLGYYKFYENESLNWFEAQIQCERDGAHMLILNSQEEDELVRRSMYTARKSWIHIGVHDLVREGVFTTVQGMPFTSTGFVKWLPGHPKVNADRNCGWIKTRDSGIGMGPCLDKGPFICELSLE